MSDIELYIDEYGTYRIKVDGVSSIIGRKAFYAIKSLEAKNKELEGKLDECSTANADFQSENKELRDELQKPCPECGCG